MAPFPYKQIFAVDPANKENVATNAAILIYAPGDPSKTPIAITDVSSGTVLPNPVMTNDKGFSSTFMHATLPQVAWEGGGLTGTFESYEGMRDEAIAAKNAAEGSALSASEAAYNAATEVQAQLQTTTAAATAAATSAANSAALVGSPADAAIAAAVGGPSTTRSALNAAYSGANLLVDGGFESGAGAVLDVYNGTYTRKSVTGVGRSGPSYIEVVATGTVSDAQVLFNDFNVSEGRTYRLSAWVRTGAGTNGQARWTGTLRKPDGTYAGASLTQSNTAPTTSTGYTEIYALYTIPAGMGYSAFRGRISMVSNRVVGNSLIIDDCSAFDVTEVTRVARSTDALATGTLNGFMSAADKYKLDATVSPKSYGAKGDGVTNDATAVQAALTQAAKGGILDLSGAKYYMGGTPLTATLTGPIGVTGGGVGALLWESGNGMKLIQNSADHTITIDGIALYTNSLGTGVALEVVGTGQQANSTSLLQPRTKRRGVIRNVNIRGAKDTGNSGWAKGIRLLDSMNFMITQVHIDGYQPTQGDFVSTHGIELVTDYTYAKAVDIVISQTYVYLVQYALDSQGLEGVLVDQCCFIGVGTGFRFDAVDAAAPLVTFTGGQIAFKNVGLDFKKSHQSVISDSLIYTHPTSGAPSTVTGVLLTDVTTTRVTGCTFVSNNGMQTGVSISGGSNRNVVESCTYYGTVTNPVVLGASTLENQVRNLQLASERLQPIINNAGSANSVETGDTGWQTSGVTVTPSTNWAVATYSIRKIKGEVWLRVGLTYSGPNVTTGADGNLGDMPGATLPTGYRPIFTYPLRVDEASTRIWGGLVNTSGVLTLSHGLPAQTLTSGTVIYFIGNYRTD